MWRKLSLLILVGLIGAAAGAAGPCLPAKAQNATSSGRPIDFQRDGIRFQIKASIKAMPGAPYVKSGGDNKTKASLEVKLRISAHAQGSQFFGVNTGSFLDFPLADGSEEKVFLQEARCHQRRGLPKVTVTAIDGSIQTDNSRVDVTARPRQLGRLLPADEISAGARQPGGTDKNGQFIAYASQTNTSRLSVNVKVYTDECPLVPVAQ